MADLTEKQKLFVKEYLIDLNATQAAIRAGYSPKTAGQIGEQNLKKLEIQAEIQKAMDERSKRTEITADRVLQELAKIGFADIKDYLSYRTALTIVGRTEGGEEIVDYATVLELRDSEDVDGTVIQEVKQTKDGLSFKLHNKLDALDKIGKHLKLFTDKVEHSGKMTQNIHTTHDLSQLSVEELKNLESILSKTTPDD